MPRFALIESNSGYIWGVVDADSALDACLELDAQLGGRPHEGVYEEATFNEIYNSEDGFDVRLAPDGFLVDNGQCDKEIAEVEALPRAGAFRWVCTE